MLGWRGGGVKCGRPFSDRARSRYAGSMVDLSLPEYDGPLDALVGALERGERDPGDIRTAAVVSAVRGRLRRDRAGIDEIALAAAWCARLLQAKAAAMLPRAPAVDEDEEEPEPDPESLAALIREYRRFRAAAEEFRGREQEGLRSFPRLAPPPVLPPSLGLGDVTLERLLAVVQEALRRQPPEPPEAAPRHTITVRERLAALEAELRETGRVNFSRFVAACRGRMEIIVGFMAVLELIKNGRAVARQPEPFGDIEIVARPADADPAAAAGD